MIEPGFAAYLGSVSEVAAIVASRIYPLVIPQHAQGDSSRLPCIVYQRLSATRGVTFCESDRLVQTSVQVDCYSRQHMQAEQIATVVREALIDFTGLMGDTHVDRVFIENEFELLDPEPGLFRVSQTYTIWYLEA